MRMSIIRSVGELFHPAYGLSEPLALIAGPQSPHGITTAVTLDIN